MKYWIPMLMCLSAASFAQAEHKTENTLCGLGADIKACDLEFLVTPKIPLLTPEACNDPVSKTYVIKNNAPIDNKITFIDLVDNDSLPESAVTIDFTVPGSCQVGTVLAPGATCTLTLLFQPCTTGEIDRLLEVRGNTSQGIIDREVITSVVANGCATVGASDGNSLAYTSNNYGSTWTISTPIPQIDQNNELFSVSCAKNSGQCAAVGLFFDGNSRRPLTYTTIDFGASWTLSEILPPPLSNFDHHLNSVSCLNNRHCVTVGNYYDGTGRFPLAYVSDDFGVSWQVETQPIAPAATINNVELFGVSCNKDNSNVEYCMAVGNYLDSNSDFQLLSYFSTDSGNTWTQKTLASSLINYRVLKGVFCNDTQHCVAVGSEGTSSVASTMPGFAFKFNGTTWNQDDTNTTVDHQHLYTSVSCNATGINQNCVAVGFDYKTSVTTNVTPLCRAEVAGTWQACNTSPPALGISGLNSVFCSSSGNCVSVGRSSPVPNTSDPLSYRSFNTGNDWAFSSVQPTPPGILNTLNGVSCSDS